MLIVSMIDLGAVGVAIAREWDAGIEVELEDGDCGWCMVECKFS